MADAVLMRSESAIWAAFENGLLALLAVNIFAGLSVVPVWAPVRARLFSAARHAEAAFVSARRRVICSARALCGLPGVLT
jgi:hypothetical protein